MKQYQEKTNKQNQENQEDSQYYNNQYEIRLIQDFPQSFIFRCNQLQNQIFFLTRDYPSSKEFKQFNDQFKCRDLSFFYKLWKNKDFQIKKYIDCILKHWQLFQIQFSEHLQQFIHIFNEKIKDIVYSQQLFPGVSELISKIKKKIGFQIGKNKLEKYEKKNADSLFQKYVEQLQSLSKRQGSFYIKINENTKIPIGQFIAENNAYLGTNAWKDIYFLASCIKRQKQFQMMNQNLQILDQRMKRKNFLEKIVNIKQKTLTPAFNKICCATFFYYNFDIYDRIVCNYPILTGHNLSSIDENKQYLYQISLDIISLLNCGGGIILFNTLKNYLQTWPKGENIIQSDQQRYVELIQIEIKNISPTVNIKSQIFITFVPIAKNPYTAGIPQIPDQKNYIKGLYVMRIVVRPKNNQIFYYYEHPKKAFVSSCIENQRRKILKGKQIIKFYKAKIQEQTLFQQDEKDQELKSMISKNINYFYDHKQCVLPEKGIKSITKEKINSTNDVKKFQKQFKYLTLLIANKNNHSQIKEKLKNKGIQCEIVSAYTNYKFKAAVNSGALYHQERFDRLLTQIAYKKQFQFNNRFVLTILVTQFLKLSERNRSNPFPKDQFINLKKWLIAEHKQQKLRLFRYQNGGQCQFYLKTQSKISTLFMYYVLSQFNEKCVFKNPPGFERMNDQEKRQKLKQYYPQIS